jgi:hypothetical protein
MMDIAERVKDDQKPDKGGDDGHEDGERIDDEDEVQSQNKLFADDRLAASEGRREEEQVAAPRRTAQADRTDLERRPARGMVKEPMIGTKIVSRVIVSMFILKGKVYFWKTKKSRAFSTGNSKKIWALIRRKGGRFI